MNEHAPTDRKIERARAVVSQALASAQLQQKIAIVDVVRFANYPGMIEVYLRTLTAPPARFSLAASDELFAEGEDEVLLADDVSTPAVDVLAQEVVDRSRMIYDGLMGHGL